MKRILIVEDDLSIQDLLHDFLKEAGYDVCVASNGVEAIGKFSEEIDLVLLDIMLPKIDGYGVCEVIRKKSDVPIIMLTALDSEENQVKGLDLQADDYITKPFSIPVLIRKIAAVLRRSSRQDDTPQTISYKDLMLDLDGYKAYIGQESIELTPREFEILRELLTHKGRISWAVPKNYQYDIEDAEWWICFLPNDLSGEDKENAYIWLEDTDKNIQEQYENEFELHFFQSDGQEVSLHDINQLTGGQISDFDKIEKSNAYTVTFSDSNSPYTLLLTRNTTKHTETEKAIQRTLPLLCIVILVGSIISSFFYSWYMTAPIKRVSKLSKQMADMDFNGVCTTKRTDEIGVLSDSLNALSQKLSTTLAELQKANQKLQADIDMERQLEKQRVEFFQRLLTN